MGKRTKKILEWIEAYSRLVDMDTKYFLLSIKAGDKKDQKKYRGISDKYNQGITNLTKKLP